MSEELVMNGAGEVDHGDLSTISGGVIAIASVPSLKNFAGIPGIFDTVLSGTISGANAVGFINGSVVGTWTIPATAIKGLSEGSPVIRESDTGTVIAIGTIDPTPTPPASPQGPVVGGTVIVSDAGQDKVFSK